MSTRSIFEHEALPYIVKHEPQKMVNDLCKYKRKTLIRNIKSLYLERDEDFNYKDGEFGFLKCELDEIITAYVIKMPIPKESGDCYRLYIYHDDEDDVYRYFTSEYETEGDEEFNSLCEYTGINKRRCFCETYCENSAPRIFYELRYFYLVMINRLDIRIPQITDSDENTISIWCPKCCSINKFNPDEIYNDTLSCFICSQCGKIFFQKGLNNVELEKESTGTYDQQEISRMINEEIQKLNS